MSTEDLGDIYLSLLHGRNDPEEELSEWGFAGPMLGPFKSIHFTYTTHVRCLDVRGGRALA